MQNFLLIMVGLSIVYFFYQMIFSDPYAEMIYSESDYDVFSINPNGDKILKGQIRRIVIKRVYSSGKIKFIEKEVKI